MAKVILTVPDEFLKEIDREAKIEHRSRSELIREALREYLSSSTGVEYGKKQKIKQAVQQMDEARKRSRGNKVKGSEIIHQWRYRLAK